MVPCQNARNTVLPDEGMLDEVWNDFIESVCVTFPPGPLVSPPISHEKLLQEWGQDKLRKDASRMGAMFPQCMLGNIEVIPGRIKGLGLCVGVWDKDPTKIFASCPVPMEIHSVEGILACWDFKIVGVSPAKGLAQALALQAILEKAYTHGILQLGCVPYVLGKCWLGLGFRHDQITRACGIIIDNEEGFRIPMFRSPSLFYVPKSQVR